MISLSASKKVSQEKNLMLTTPFMEQEIKLAVANYERSKSPGPDGFNFKFIKESWDIVKDDILKMVTEFHWNVRIVRGSNPSFIVLLPKKEGARCLNDYRPISLIGYTYKILAKVLAAD